MIRIGPWVIEVIEIRGILTFVEMPLWKWTITYAAGRTVVGHAYTEAEAWADAKKYLRGYLTTLLELIDGERE